jgi:predicted porin
LQFSPFVLALINTDARDISYFGSGAINYINNVLVTGLFNPNAVSYTTPEFGGLQGSAMFAFGGESGDFQSGRQYSGSVTYRTGGLLVNAAFYDGNAGGASPTPIPSTIAFVGRAIGAGYTFGSLVVKASFVDYKVAGSFDSRVFGGGASYNITPAIAVDGGVWFTSDGNNTQNRSILGAVGAKYYLSKKTSLYSQVAVVNNHGAMDTGLSINGALYGVKGTTVGATVGIQHNF